MATPAAVPAAPAHHFAVLNGIQMHYVEAGEGDPVVLLHGFPESWYSWRHQITDLADRYRVIAPDLRGYNETEATGPYDTDTLQRDVLALIEHLGASSAHVVGHDWGGALGWLLAMQHPGSVRSLAICNMPHPSIFRRRVWQPPQLLRSWYILLFQLPWLPERVMSSDNYRRLAKVMIRNSRPGTYTKDDMRTMLQQWRSHGLSGGINWYRALLRQRPGLPEPPPLILAPTTVIWGEQDFALDTRLLDGTEELVWDLRIHRIADAGHFVHQEVPERVTTLLREHLDRVTHDG